MAKKSESVANVVECCHFKVNDKGVMRISKRKLHWLIPDNLIGTIEKGQMLRVKSASGCPKVLVCGLKHMEENDPEFPTKSVYKIIQNV